METTKPAAKGREPPIITLRADTLSTDLVQYLSAHYLVTVEASNNEIIYELFNRPTEK